MQTLRAAARESEGDVLQHKALEDALTGVGNRRAADERLVMTIHDTGTGSMSVVAALLARLGPWGGHHRQPGPGHAVGQQHAGQPVGPGRCRAVCGQARRPQPG